MNFYNKIHSLLSSTPSSITPTMLPSFPSLMLQGSSRPKNPDYRSQTSPRRCASWKNSTGISKPLSDSRKPVAVYDSHVVMYWWCCNTLCCILLYCITQHNHLHCCTLHAWYKCYIDNVHSRQNIDHLLV